MIGVVPSSLAVVVVTYRPADDVRPRLVGYAAAFGAVIVVDNTEGRPAFIGLDAVTGLSYLPQGSNLGIAEALNIGVREAASRGHSHVLLLDQDSVAEPAAAAAVVAACTGDIGIAAMRPVLAGMHRGTADLVEAAGCCTVTMAITSGSVLSMTAWRVCGEFNAALFIDYVDYEYCLRLRRHRFRIVECVGAPLWHALGAPKAVRLGSRRLRYVSHAPLRSYYRVRNGLHVAAGAIAARPAATADIAKVLCKELVKALFVEDDRRARLGYMLKGLRDWVRGRYGKLEEIR